MFPDCFQFVYKTHVAWFLQAFIIPAASLVILNHREPMRNVFLTGLFCGSEEVCPMTVRALSYAHQALACVYGYLTNLLFDILPVSNALIITKQMQVLLAVFREINVPFSTVHFFSSLPTTCCRTLVMVSVAGIAWYLWDLQRKKRGYYIEPVPKTREMISMNLLDVPKYKLPRQELGDQEDNEGTP